MIRSVLVYGGGSAGFLFALTLKSRLPNLPITILRCQDQGDGSIAEGTTTTTFPFHLHHYCKFDLATFYRLVEPLWKLGTRLVWGPRPYFNCVFGFEIDTQFLMLPLGTGYYLDNNEPFEAAHLQSCLMFANKVWLRDSSGAPQLAPQNFSYQVKIDRLVRYFETLARERLIPVVDEDVVEISRDERGVAGVRLASGRTLAADLYVDASGPASRLLGEVLGVSFVSYEDALFCDRAVLGNWDRTIEPIKPYTTAETMNAGWCWQIEHERQIDRGYVYSSRHIRDQDAEAEFRALNPKIRSARTVRFRSGRRESLWVENVAGIGDAAAFLDPLEGTALAATCLQCQSLAETLADCDLEPNASTMYNHNRELVRSLDSWRDFLAVHYRFNTRLNTPFWWDCRENVDLHWANRVVETFQETGPSVLWRKCLYDETDWREFGMEGYLALLVGQCVPYRCSCKPSEDDRHTWARIQQTCRHKVAGAFTVSEALSLVRSPDWVWPKGLYTAARAYRP